MYNGHFNQIKFILTVDKNPLSLMLFNQSQNLHFFSPETANGPAADILQQAFLPVVGHDVCSQPDWWNVLATEKTVCAGGDGITAGCNVRLH